MNRTGNYRAQARENPSFKMHAGQPPQRPPSLGPNPALGGPFRTPYPTYGIPPRNVMPGYPALPNHRTTQNVVPQPSPNYIQQRGQSGFPFVGGMQQQQQSQQTSSQHTPQTPLSHTSHQQQQPQTQQTAVTPSLPPHLAQNSAPSLGTAPSASSASEVGLDPNDFPALGSTPTSITTPSTTNATSYASQAGTGAGIVGNGASSATSVQRDFTPDDFPALGGSGQTIQPQSAQTPQSTDGHPPGLNGFPPNNEQHRQNLLGSLTGNGQQQPGVLNLGQARSQGNFQSEADKRVSCWL
jgi:CCR4-NOT transcription complex subunit 2